MGFLSKTYDRYRTGNGRLEGDLSNPIEEFFKNQPGVKKYDIVDKDNWIVDIDGSIELYEDDLYNGELFFKIGKLSGDLFSHTRRLKPSAVPTELTGEIIFVEDEEELKRKKQNYHDNQDNKEDHLDMGYLSTKPMSKKTAYKKLNDVLSECVANEYDDYDIEEIIKRIKNDWNNKDNLNLSVRIKPTKGGNKEIDFYIGDKLLDITAIQKALYIQFILPKEGRSTNINKEFKEELKNIYKQIHGRVQDDHNGIESLKFEESTFLACRSNIRDAIKDIISNSKVVDEFAIEGYKAQPFKVQKATDEVRNEIRKYFTLN